LAGLRGADAIIVVSRFTYDVVIQMIGASAAEKVTLIQNGVNPTLFAQGPKRPDIMKRYGLEDSFVFVSVCRLLEKKGIDNALRAFASIAADEPKSRFLIVGTGPYQEELEALTASLGLADRVTFAGLVSGEDLADYYRVGNVFVMPNRKLENGDTEGFGLVFLEANSCGLPVIAGCDGGSTDAVQHQVNGLVVDGRSVPGIAAAMRSLRDDAALWDRLHNGALEVAGRSGWADKANTFLRVCCNRLNEPGE
jgi:phosphatidylinositol alpha-1,6-mannosyltransferase